MPGLNITKAVKLMRKGIFFNFGYRLRFPERLELIHRTGFDSVMLWWGGGDEEDVVAQAERQGLYCCNAHLPYDNINCIWLDGEEGDACTDRLCSLIAKCGRLSVPVAVLHVSSSRTPPPFGEVGMERVRRMLDAGEKYDVDLAFENLYPVEYLDYIFANTSSKRAKFCYDSGHHYNWRPEKNLLADYGDRLAALHLDDNEGDRDSHMLPYDGKVNWDAVTDGLAALDYDGVLSVELHQDRHEKYAAVPAEEYMRAAFERTLRIETELENKKAALRGGRQI